MKLKNFNQKIIALVLTIAALMVGQSAWGMSTFEVSNPYSDNTFRITRTGNTAVEETIDWRVVSLSAMAGMHFTGYQGNYSGTVTFAANVTYVDVTITETTPSGTNSDCFLYQNTTSRSYRFEVLDKNGDILASKNRTISSGLTQFSAAKVSNSITNLVYFNNGNYASGMSSSKYVDVSYTPPTDSVYSGSGVLKGYVLIDDSYDYKRKWATVSTSSLINSTGATASYLQNIGYEIYATVCFTEQERDDGYQYVQIVAGNASHSFDGADPNGQVNNPNNSVYKACFELSTGSKQGQGKVFFPHRYDSETGEFSTDGKLWQQKFRTGFRADNSGSIVLRADVSNITTRFDAGGNDDDTWGYKNFFVRMALCDAAAPTVLDTNGYVVSGGRHQKGNTFYVSVAFNEIVTITGSTKKLTTSWGDAVYEEGDGTNVLTFKGEIGSSASGTLKITGMSGTIKDLADNSFSNPWSSNNKDLVTTLDEDYAWTTADFNSLATNTYEIATKTDLRHLADYVNNGGNNCQGLTFLQTKDITCDNTYIPIANRTSITDETSFNGTYDGQGNTVSGITANYSGNYVGLFGYNDINGTIRNVVLASSTFTGYLNVGGIVGSNDGTVENCRVESSVNINAVSNGSSNLGGIAGANRGLVIGCISAATVSTSNNYTYSMANGGIVGHNNSGSVRNCLYTGTNVSVIANKGAIVGFDDGNNGTLTNNYYTAINLGGVDSSDQNGARRARTVTLGTGVALVGNQTPYEIQNHSSLTAIGSGSYALSYNDGTNTTIYSGEGQTLTLNYTGDALATGYAPFFSVDETPLERNIFTMPDNNVSVTVAGTDVWGVSGNTAANGSANHPYLIGSTYALDLLAKNVNGSDGYTANNFSGKYFRQTANITYDGTENNYTPIGNISHYFEGHYNGGGYTISGIYINLTSKSDHYQGLFGRVNGGTVENVFLTNSNITGCENVGGIVGRNDGGIVKNCRVESTVTVNAGFTNSLYHGGVVGKNSNGTISGCFCGAQVNNNGKASCNYYGGIVGGNISNGIIKDCLYTGTTVIGITYVGSIAGKNDGGSLTNNYYTDIDLGAVNGSDKDGARRARTVTLSENIAIVGDETFYNVSGLTAIGSGSYALSYNDGNNTTIYSGDGQTVSLSYTGDVMATGYAAVFSATAGTVSGNRVIMPASDVSVTFTSTDVWGVSGNPAADGSTEHPYLIGSTHALDLLAKNVNGSDGYTANTFQYEYFLQTANITYDGTENNYTPIGNNSSHRFNGHFDGGGKTISGISISRTGSDDGGNDLGLFGRVNSNGTVQNVILANSTFTGAYYIGGIVGFNNGTIQNCRVESTVTIKAGKDAALYHGGIVGYMIGNHKVIGCVSAASIQNNGKSLHRYCGGIVGYNQSANSTIQDCLYAGNTIEAYEYNGAIIGGYSSLGYGILTNNYYTAIDLGGVAGSDQNGARRARTVTLDENIALVGDETAYDVSGLTAIGSGSYALSYNDGTTTTLYSGATQDVTLSYTGVPATGYVFNGFTATNGGTISGNTLTMPAADISVSTTFTDVWGVTNTPVADGSEEHPYIITSTTGLDLLAKNVNGLDGYTANNFEGKYFTLGEDITYTHKAANEEGANTENNYTAIGGYIDSYWRNFCGTFDGDGKTISGIRIYKGGGTSADSSQGLFGQVLGGTIKNVTLTDARITGKQYLGGIAGYITENNGTGGIIENCHVTSSVIIHAVANNASNHGGIVGEVNGGTVSGCSSAATLTMASGLTGCCYYGGIVGALNGNMQNCLVVGASISGTDQIGAIAGDKDKGSTLTNNYYTADGPGGVNGSDQDGARRARVITLDENIALVGDETIYDVSGLTAIGSGNYALSYNDGNTTTIYSGEGQDLTLNYTGASIQIGCKAQFSVNGTPLQESSLTMPASDASLTVAVLDLWGVTGTDAADGSEQHPYIITSTTGLDLLAKNVNGHDGYTANNFEGKYFTLGADITYTHKAANEEGANTENNYTAIGAYIDNTYRSFRGTFDGDNKTVSGIRIYKSGTTNADGYQGLFGSVSGGTIKNVILTDARITGKHNIGGIAGYITENNNIGGIIENCHVTNTVTIHAVISNAYSHGGIVGDVNSGSVSGCTSAATLTMVSGLTGCGQYGGIAGYLDGNMQNCLVVGANIPDIHGNNIDKSGAIAGHYFFNNNYTFSHNYYRSVTIGGATTGIGIGNDDNNNSRHDITTNDGARSLHALTLGDDISATATVAVSYNNIDYYTTGTEVTLSYTGTVPEGYMVTYSYNDGTNHTVTGNSFTMPAADVTVSATFDVIPWEGSGNNEDDPYIILYCSQLDLLATNVNNNINSYSGKFFKLGADIAYDPTDLDANGENYTAIGSFIDQYRPFRGTFDGDGHTVSGIRINKTGETDADQRQGLFGYVQNATIKNVILSDAHITGLRQVGGIVGDHSFTNTIENCLVLNSQITATSNTDNCGVIIGYYYSNNVTLTDNYYYNCSLTQGGSTRTTDIGTGSNSVADRDGARGVNKLTLGEHISATPAAAVTYQGNSYYVAGTTVTLSAEGYNAVYTVKDAANNDVTLTNGDTFEMPASDVTVSADLSVIAMDGSGTETDPWIIMYRSQLDLLATRVNSGNRYSGKFFKLGDNISYPYTTAWDDATSTENNYSAIGISGNPFQGTFDGDGHTVSGIRIYKGGDNETTDSYQGFFGSTLYGTVKNLTLSDARITGLFCVGGIVGAEESLSYIVSIIENCHVTNTVDIHAAIGSSSHGGIVGYNAKSTVRGCTSAAVVDFADGLNNCQSFGGIVGYNHQGTVENCLALGCVVKSRYETGAIVGDNSGTLSHNYYYGCTVNGTANATDVGCKAGDINDEKNPEGAVHTEGIPLLDTYSNDFVINAYNGVANQDYTLAGRTLWKDGDWNTLCLPFDLTISGSVLDGDNVDVRTLSSTEFSNGTLTLNFTDKGNVTNICAGVPYIIKWDNTGSNLVNPTFSGVTISNTTNNVSTTYADFKGTYSPIVWETENKSILFVGINNLLYWPKPEGENIPRIGAFRGYFQLKGITAGDVQQARMNVDDDDVTGIQTTDYANYTDSDAWYTVDGRKLDGKPTAKGLYINKGKIIVINK